MVNVDPLAADSFVDPLAAEPEAKARARTAVITAGSSRRRVVLVEPR
jgi:hypothetical protein